MEDIIPILGVIGAFGSPVLIVGLIGLFYYLKNRRKYELMQTLAEQGRDIPIELLVSPKNRLDGSNNLPLLRTALVWIAIGLGATVTMVLSAPVGFTGLALIPLLIGIAYLVTYMVARRDKSRAAANETADDTVEDAEFIENEKFIEPEN